MKLKSMTADKIILKIQNSVGNFDHRAKLVKYYINHLMLIR